MPDLGTRLPELLRDLSSQMPSSAHEAAAVARRARRRRLFNALAGGATAIVLVGASVAGLRALTPNDDRRPPPLSGTESGAIDAIWPETTSDGLRAAQRQIDDGHSPWRTDPEQTAVAFATNVMGWSYEDVVGGTVERTEGHATVWIEDQRLAGIVTTGSGGPADPRTIVKLAQLGRTGELGVWSVLAVEGQMIRLRPITVAADGALEIGGSLTYLSEAETVRVDVLDGADLDSSVGGGVVPLGPDFAASFPAPPSTDGVVTVLVRVLWNGGSNRGKTLSATAIPVEVGSAEPRPSPAPVPTVTLVYQHLAFGSDTIVVPAGVEAVIRFESRDEGVRSNVAIYPSSSELADPIFRGDAITGPAVVEYDLPPLDPGTYYFRDDMHPNANGTLIAAGGGGSALPPFDGPAAVRRTREAIAFAVVTRDFATMRRLIDPNTFSYNFDDGSNPIPLWKDDPSVLDPILTVLEMPPAQPEEIQGYGTFYIWPYLVDSDFQHLSPTEIADLHTLGFNDAAIDDMRRFGSYLGPRLAIDGTGVWRNYTTGGD